MLSELNQTDILYPITIMQNLKNKLVNKTNKKNRLTDTEQTSGYQWGAGRRTGNIAVGDFLKKGIMRVYEIMHVKLLKTVKCYRI